ncbi:Uncharacterised protein [Bordetella pertussis]|nr:Uncharacterised protein [Bordetella pertussis]
MPQPSSWASLASERPICSVSWRSSHSGASARAITVTSWLSIHARVLASSCTNPSSMAASRPYE